MEPSESIGHRIKQVRGELSQKAFGLRIGLSQTAVTALENDQSEPRLGTFNSIIEAFNVNPEWLRTGAGTMLRDGRALAQLPPTAPSEVKSPLAIDLPTKEDYAALQEENRRLREQLAQRQGQLSAVEEERSWLRVQVGGKPEASSDAAGDVVPLPEMVAVRNHEYVAAEEPARKYIGYAGNYTR